MGALPLLTLTFSKGTAARSSAGGTGGRTGTGQAAASKLSSMTTMPAPTHARLQPVDVCLGSGQPAAQGAEKGHLQSWKQPSLPTKSTLLRIRCSRLKASRYGTFPRFWKSPQM